MRDEDSVKSTVVGKRLALQLARQDTLHAEAITQQRLNNFLFCVSILFLVWATIFVNQTTELAFERRVALVLFSLLSFILSVAYTLLGYRGDRFITMHYDISLQLESKLLDDTPPTVEPIVSLQSGEEYICQSELFSGNSIRIPGAARMEPVSTHLLIMVPASFALTAIILFALSIS